MFVYGLSSDRMQGFLPEQSPTARWLDGGGLQGLRPGQGFTAQAPAPVVEFISPAPSVVRSPAPVVEHIAPAPAVFQSPAPVVEYVSSAPDIVITAVFSRDSAYQRFVEQNTMITMVQQLVVELWVQQLLVELIIKALSRDRSQPLIVPNSSWPCSLLLGRRGGGRGGGRGGRGHGRDGRGPVKSRRVPAHADVSVVPVRELPTGVEVHVRSLGERTAWYLAATCLVPVVTKDNKDVAFVWKMTSGAVSCALLESGTCSVPRQSLVW